MKKHLRALPLVSFAILTATSACSTSPSLPPEIAETASPRGDLETIVIMGTNDIHGALAPIPLKSREEPGVEPVAYERGGAAILAGHIRLLKKDFGDRLLILDGGDEFQGSLESNLEEGGPMVRFFNTVGLHAAAVGNHEFDFGPVGPEGTPGDPLGALKARMSEAKYNYLAANIVEKSTKKMPELPNTVPSRVFQVGKLKVGVIGLSTQDTPVTTRAEYVKNLEFTDLKDATVREAEKLRAQGAQLVLITAHAGLVCKAGKGGTQSVFRKETDPQGECGEKDEIVRMLKALPQGTVDAVVAGHTHTIVHHWIEGVPVIQAGTRNLYFNLMYLTYDWTQKKLVTDRTRIEGPIPVCPKVFENQKDCDGERPAPRNGRGSLVTPTFHGHTVEADSAVEKLLQPVFARTDATKRKVVGEAARPVEHPRTRESEAGNLVADALRERTGADLAIVNGGGIRAPFEAGPITFESVFRTLPFDNSVAVLTVTGKDVKNILRVAQSGARGFFSVSGMTVRIIELESDAPSNDLNGDKKIEPWEVNRILGVTLSDGKPLKDAQTYKLATIDFLVTGGDNLGWAMNQIPQDRIQIGGFGVMRDAVLEHLAKVSPINAIASPLVDPAHPRLKLEKAKIKGKSKKKRAT